MKKSLLQKVTPQEINDGCLLCVLETGKQIPFLVKRAYYISKSLPTNKRGYHAHCKLEQILICIKGSVKVVADDGNSREEITLNGPSDAVYLRALTWHELSEIDEDTILLFLTSETYEAKDYIYSYPEFIKAKRKVKVV